MHQLQLYMEASTTIRAYGNKTSCSTHQKKNEQIPQITSVVIDFEENENGKKKLLVGKSMETKKKSLIKIKNN